MRSCPIFIDYRQEDGDAQIGRRRNVSPSLSDTRQDHKPANHCFHDNFRLARSMQGIFRTHQRMSSYGQAHGKMLSPHSRLRPR